MALGLLAVAGVVTWFIFRRAVTYEPPEVEVSGDVQWTLGPADGALTYRGAQLRWHGGVAALHLTGEGAELGAAHGRLLGERVGVTAAATRAALRDLVRGSGLWFGLTHDLRVGWRLRFLDDGLSQLDRAMVAGVQRGANLEVARYQELVRLQAVWDIASAPATSDTAGLSRALAVLAQQPGAAAGSVWLGHAFSAPGLDDGGESLAPVVSFVRPRDGLAWAAVSWPGSVGVTTGVNAKGIALVVNPAATRDVRATRTARPILLLARAVLERATTLDDAVATLEHTETLGAASYLVVDGAASKWAVVERSPTRAVVSRPSAPLALGDFLAAAAFASDPKNDRGRRASPSAARVARAQRLLQAPLTSPPQLAAVLRDRRALDGAALPLGHRGVPFDAAAQLVILDPGRLALWVADPSADGLLRVFDLRAELDTDGPRAPLSEIPADPELASAALAQLAVARRDLRAARRLWEADQIAAARQRAARALARAPTLPEAILLAGDLAAAANDPGAARELWQRWLDGGPDHPEREQLVRAQLTNPRGW